MAKVSVIMPVYNGVPYIHQAIESMLRQSLDDWELVIVNDGSTDRTVTVIGLFRDRRIKLVTQANAGAAAARNVGLALATGEYLAFLDADDLYLPRALESNAGYLDSRRHCGVVYADGFYCDQDGWPTSTFSDYRPCDLTESVLDSLVVTPFISASHCAMIRRQVVETRDLRFEPDRSHGEDWEFFIRLAETEAFCRNPEIVCKYRVHGNNITLRQRKDRSISLGKVRRALIESPTFRRLRAATKATVLYQLLFENLPDDQAAQRALLASGVLDELPNKEQTNLLREVAVHWLMRGWSTDEARGYLAQARAKNPAEIKTYVLWATSGLSPKLVRRVVVERRRFRAMARRNVPRSPFAAAERQAPADRNRQPRHEVVWN